MLVDEQLLLSHVIQPLSSPSLLISASAMLRPSAGQHVSVSAESSRSQTGRMRHLIPAKSRQAASACERNSWYVEYIVRLSDWAGYRHTHRLLAPDFQVLPTTACGNTFGSACTVPSVKPPHGKHSKVVQGAERIRGKPPSNCHDPTVHPPLLLRRDLWARRLLKTHVVSSCFESPRDRTFIDLCNLLFSLQYFIYLTLDSNYFFLFLSYLCGYI